MRIAELFAMGGVVMWPLLCFSVLAIALIAERLAFWFRVNRRQQRLVREFLSLYRREPTVAMPKLKRNADLPIARIFLEALEIELANPREFRMALNTAIQAEIPLLKRFGTIFETIIGVAPLLGLLGTILGLIRSFASLKLGDIGAGGTGAVTGGISEALVSTAAGLMVAIVVLLFANLFRGLCRRQLTMIHEYGGRLELFYCRAWDATAARTSGISAEKTPEIEERMYESAGGTRAAASN